MLKNKKITILGLGVLGGSYAKGLHKAGIGVSAIDIDEEALQTALTQGWIASGSSDPSFVKDSDIVISCLYPHTFIHWIEENGHYLKPGCILTDVTGVKRAVMEKVNAALPEGVEYIACHPMAGRESRGLAYADENCFTNANFIIVPDHNSKTAIDLSYEIAETLGFGNIAELTPEEHDRMVGFLSQLTHVIAVALMNVADNTDLAAYTGDSFRDLTRIANINELLWPELFVLNKDYLIKEIDAFTDEMQAFRKLIEDEDYEAMQKKLRISTARRAYFNKKKGDK